MGKQINNSFDSFGQPWIAHQDIDFIQDGVRDISAFLIESLIGNSFNPALSYIIKGCVLSSAAGNTTISAGYIFGVAKALGSATAKTYLYKVDSVTFADPAGPNVVIGTVTPSYAIFDPVVFANGSSQNIHAEYKIVFSAGISGSADIDFSSLLDVANPKDLASYAAGWTPGLSVSVFDAPKCTLSMKRVQLHGGIVSTGVPPGISIANIPAQFIPAHRRDFIVPYYTSSAYTFINVFIDTGGLIAMANAADIPSGANHAISLNGITYLI